MSSFDSKGQQDFKANKVRDRDPQDDNLVHEFVRVHQRSDKTLHCGKSTQPCCGLT